MSCYMGPIGGLVSLSCPAKLSRDTPGGMVYTTKRTVTGRALQYASVSRRAWAVGTTNAKPEDLAALEAFASGGMGAGPFVFVPPDAVATNLVTPWDSLLSAAPHQLVRSVPTGWQGMGGRVMPDGATVPGALVRTATAATSPIYMTGKIPLPPGGGTVTVSAWIAGTDGNPAILYGYSEELGRPLASSPPVDSPQPQRVSATFDAPDDATYFQVTGIGSGSLYAGICATWTDRAYPYSPGRGCDSAVLQTTGWDTVLAVAGDPNWGRYDQANYVVLEAG